MVSWYRSVASPLDIGRIYRGVNCAAIGVNEERDAAAVELARIARRAVCGIVESVSGPLSIAVRVSRSLFDGGGSVERAAAAGSRTAECRAARAAPAAQLPQVRVWCGRHGGHGVALARARPAPRAADAAARLDVLAV